MKFQIQTAQPKHALGILKVYEPHVVEGYASFETNVPTEAEMVSRIKNHSETHPWLCLIFENEIIGYAYASPHRARKGYDWTVETSIYMLGAWQGRGLAGFFYKFLLNTLKRQGFQQALAGISLPNSASVALHVAVGFEKNAHYPKVGFKHGKWIDTAWYQINLNAFENETRNLISMKEISTDQDWLSRRKSVVMAMESTLEHSKSHL